jgi:PBSX family phage terminase large subunit
MKPLEASLWKPLPDDLKEKLLLSGVVPVNDVFMPHWGVKEKVMLFYGSYGSGKSVYIVDKWIDKAIEQPYFRGYYGRKVLEDVRKSVFKTITDRIKERRKQHLFNFSDAPNGSMIITCRKNGNEMNPFGANDADSMKSIKDPTDFFCEELDQFSFTDFGTIFSRLRKEGVDLQFWGAFNTEKVYRSHWIRRILMGEGEHQFDIKPYKLKANYTDNHFIDHDAYYKALQLVAGGDIVKLNAISRGEWGIAQTGGEWLKKFNESKHVRKAPYGTGQIFLCFDDNVVPYVTCTIWQVDSEGKQIKQVKEILSRHPDNNAPKAAEKICNWLLDVRHKDKVVVCGDPSAKKRTTVDENSASFYDKIIEVLTKRGYHVENKVMKSAPEVGLTNAFINAILEINLFGWSIVVDELCFESIEEYLLVKEGEDGHILKEMVTDKETNQRYQKNGHILDSLRYMILTVLAKQFEEYKGFRTEKLKGMAGRFH